MIKQDFSSAPVIEIAPERCEFDSTKGPVVMWLAPLNDRWTGLMYKRRDELVQRFITGGWTDKDAAGNDRFQEKPEAYFLPGEMLPLSGGIEERTLLKIARIETMQKGPMEGRYSFDDLLPMIERSGHTWEAILVKAFEIQQSYIPGKAWPVPVETPMTSLSVTDSAA